MLAVGRPPTCAAPSPSLSSLPFSHQLPLQAGHSAGEGWRCRRGGGGPGWGHGCEGRAVRRPPRAARPWVEESASESGAEERGVCSAQLFFLLRSPRVPNTTMVKVRPLLDTTPAPRRGPPHPGMRGARQGLGRAPVGARAGRKEKRASSRRRRRRRRRRRPALSRRRIPPGERSPPAPRTASRTCDRCAVFSARSAAPITLRPSRRATPRAPPHSLPIETRRRSPPPPPLLPPPNRPSSSMPAATCWAAWPLSSPSSC